MFSVTVTVQLRFNDFDVFNHVNNVAYFALMETARVEAFRQLPRTLRGHLVVRHASCDYNAEIRGGTRSVDIAVTCEKVGTSSFSVLQEIRTEGVVAGVGRATMVVLDEHRRPRPIADSERGYLEG
ncbi:MAG: acyl-CoA thioesterase [Mycobacteriales bacterium]